VFICIFFVFQTKGKVNFGNSILKLPFAVTFDSDFILIKKAQYKITGYSDSYYSADWTFDGWINLLFESELG